MPEESRLSELFSKLKLKEDPADTEGDVVAAGEKEVNGEAKGTTGVGGGVKLILAGVGFASTRGDGGVTLNIIACYS